MPALLLWLQSPTLSGRRLFLHGWLFGLGYFGCGVYWIYNSLHDFGMAPPVVAGGLTLVLVMYLALAPATILLCWHIARARFGAASIWLLPLLWFGVEWLRGWLLTGMPWLSLGYSQTNSPLAGFAPLIGVYGIGALCVLLAVALLLAADQRRHGWLALLLVVPASGYLLQKIDWTEPMAQTLEVGLVQGNIPQELKWRPEQRDHIFNTYWRESRDLWSRDLIVWPETALPGNSRQISRSLLPVLQSAALEQGTTLLSGVLHAGDDRKYYNSVIQFGAEQGIYHKRHLVVFGEYYPMRWLLNLFTGLINIPHSDLTPGPDAQPPMRVEGMGLGLSICWEDVFSRDILRDLPHANLLVNVSNDAWFGNSTAPHQHLQIAQMRSLETERAMVRATNNGISAFIDYKGQISEQSPQFQTLSMSATVQGRQGVTPFFYFARVQWLTALLPVALLLLGMRRRAG